MLSPHDEQLEDAVAIMEGMKPRLSGTTCIAHPQLGNLTNYMNRLEGR